jgi:20S proteasome subunit beta 3
MLIYKVSLFKLRENRDMKAKTFMSLVSTSLYEKRFGPYFVTPIVIGLDKSPCGKIETIIATYDSIGAIDTGDFATGGTADQMLLGVCESFFSKDMTSEQLEETLAQTLTSGLDRDALSGWGGLVYTLSEGSLKIKELKTKMT